MATPRGARWDLWLAAGGVTIALLVAVLAIRADRVLREHHQLAIDGQVLALAHQIELDLRGRGPIEARAILQRQSRARADLVRGMALSDASHQQRIAVGDTDGAPDLKVEVFLGTRSWSSGAGAGDGSGRRLEVYLRPGAASRPVSESLVFWGALNASALLLGLSAVAGRRLRGFYLWSEREATRRRLESLGRAGAGLAHQLRSPLATIKGSAQLLLESGGAGDRRVERIVEQAGRIEFLLEQLLDFARPPRAEPGEVPLAPLLRELAASEPRLRIGETPERPVVADRGHLEQILLNLISNALELSAPQAPVEVSARVRTDGRRDQVLISVMDRGPGPGPDPEALFQPYVTSRADGTGLGLPIARALAEANGGSLTLSPRPQGGAVATLTLPLAEAAR